MPLDTCITNVGEYYSSHYLDSTFSKDLAKWTEHWKTQGSQAAPRRLQCSATRYFQAKAEALDEEDPAHRTAAGEHVAGWHAHLLQALGYSELQPFDIPVDGGHAFVPALGRMNRYNRPWLVVCETFFCLPEGSLKEGMPDEDPLEMSPDTLKACRAYRAQALRRGLEPLSGAGLHGGGRAALGVVSGRQPGVAAGPQHVLAGAVPGF